MAACVKHLAVNNQEANRYGVNTVVDERTLHEIYLPAFKAAVQEGGVWTIMGAFNGLDMEFGTRLGSPEAFDNYYLAKPYLRMIREGEVGEEELNGKVRRILRMMYRTNMASDRPWGSLATPEHATVSRQVAEEGIVLLKNEKVLLPLDLSKVSRILVVGENAVRTTADGGGSSEAQAKYEIVPLQGIRKIVGTQAEVAYQPGYSSSQSVSADSLKEAAIRAAKSADVVIYIGGMLKEEGQDSEGADRTSYNLPFHQDELLSALAEANPRLITVMISGNAYAMPWLNGVSTLLQAWYGGSEGGTAIASVLFGQTNPSGKLPFTFPVRLEDNAAHALNAFGDVREVVYKEGIWVGYRWTEK